MKHKSAFLIFILFWTVGCSNESQFPSVKDLSVRWELIENNYQNKGMFKSTISITNHSSDKTLENKGWELYFNFTPARRMVMDSIPATVKMIHINGDFYKIIPGEKFPPLHPGETFTLPILSSYLAIKYSDAPDGFYFVFEESPGKFSEPLAVTDYSVATIRPDQVKRDASDVLTVPTALSRYQENLKLNSVDDKDIPLIIPTPYQVKYFAQTILMDATYEIQYEPAFRREAEYLQETLQQVLKTKLKLAEYQNSQKSNKRIVLRKDILSFSPSQEAYRLSVSAADGIEISGNGQAGVFYGLQSFLAVLPVESYTGTSDKISIRECLVNDYPQFPYRGMLLDVVRHFHSKESVKKLLSLMAFYKMNKLHFHLTDDEGWRIEIQGLPELTEVGSKRGHTLTENDKLIPAYGDGPSGQKLTNGFYTREEFIEILKFANMRQIEIIPEVDLPGHARAAIKAMDARYSRYAAKGDLAGASKYLLRDLKDSSTYSSVQGFNDNVICPCQEGIYNFVETVSKEIKDMYREAGVPLQTIHLGGDEVAEGAWEKSPACAQLKKDHPEIKSIRDIKVYFLKRTTALINAQQVLPAVVEDAMIYRDKEDGKNELKTLNEFSESKIKVYTWCNVWGWGLEDLAYKLANEGFPVVLCPVTNVYFDLAYTNEPEEPGLYWGGFNDARKAYEYTPLNVYQSIFTDMSGNTVDEGGFKSKVKLTEKGKPNIIGIQAMLFSETLKDPAMLEYYTFPKLIGLAERGWAQQPAWVSLQNREKRLTVLNEQWNIFANTLGKRELPRLDYLAGGVQYRLPPPGAIIESGELKANTEFPGLMIRYTTNGSDPDVKSPVYTGPVKVTGTVKLSTFSSNGRSSRVVEIK